MLKAVTLCAAASAAAFAPTSVPQLRSSATVMRAGNGGGCGEAGLRRHVLQVGAFAALSGGTCVQPAAAKKARGELKQQLLDDNGNPETLEERKARIKEERKRTDGARKAAEEKAKSFEAENGVANVET